MFGHRYGKGTIVKGGVVSGFTDHCLHCGYHFEVKPGSGVRRGWCGYCKGPTCGKEECDVCVPFEVKLDFEEGRINDFNRIYLDAWKEVQRIRSQASKTTNGQT